MSEPLTGADTSRLYFQHQRAVSEAADKAMEAIQSLREGKAHQDVYHGADGQQRKLQERAEAARKFFAARKAISPLPVQKQQKEKEFNPYDFVPFGGRSNWRGD